jgi:predicted transcriptional regulator of viral defense system
MPGRLWERLHAHAVEQYGYLTAADARELGENPVQLVIMHRRGILERTDRGLYRFPDVPVTSNDQLMEATLWPRQGGVLSHDTALDVHDLCDIDPQKIHLTVPAATRVRRQIPTAYVLHRRDLPATDITLHEGIRVVTARRAILDGIESALGPHLLGQAVDTAVRRGVITAEDLRLIERLDGSLARRLPRES